jgi:hypothetical protein
MKEELRKLDSMDAQLRYMVANKIETLDDLHADLSATEAELAKQENIRRKLQNKIRRATPEKKEEYREIKPFWIKRLTNLNQDPLLFSYRNRCQQIPYKDYTHVRFRYGYTKKTMTFPITSIDFGKGNKNWGAPDYDVFIIKFDSTPPAC